MCCHYPLSCDAAAMRPGAVTFPANSRLSPLQRLRRLQFCATSTPAPQRPTKQGADKPLLSFSKADEQEDKKDVPRPVICSYSFSAMLLTGWSTSVGGEWKAC